MARYGDKMVMVERLPGVWSGAMGDFMYTAHADDPDACREMIAFVQKKA